MPDVEINGVAYRLAEDAEGEHYSLSAEPLRPPNAVTVQGEDNQKFQMRPDTLLWSLSDWSGGEDQQKFDPENGNKWRELEAVRVFDPAGVLRPGWGIRALTDGTSILGENGAVVRRGTSLYLLNRNANSVRPFSTTGGGQWGSATTLTGPTNGAEFCATSDGLDVFWMEKGTNNIWKWDGSTFSPTVTQIDDGSLPVMGDPGITELGPYVYVYDPEDGQIWEVPKAGGTTTLIDDFSTDPGFGVIGVSSLVAVGGKLYALVNKQIYTAVREITPTSAAGAGFGAEVARLPGVYSFAMWTQAGILYIVGWSGAVKSGTVFYLTPGGEYGSLGRLRVKPSGWHAATGAQNGDLLQHFFVTSGDLNTLMQVDAISGNMVSLGQVEDFNTIGPGAFHRSWGYIWSIQDAVSKRTFQAHPDHFPASSYAISPWNDFALADEKILSSLVLSMKELPADWRVRVDYAVNDEDTWTNIIDETTTNSTGLKTQVSTDTSTVKFRTLSLRIRMDYTGAADPITTAPTILGVDALAMVAKPTKVWRLLLDLSDSTSRAVGVSGSRQATNLSTAADTESVVAFKDYYGSHTPGEAEEHDVIIDSYALVLSQPGEGVAAVTLKETS